MSTAVGVMSAGQLISDELVANQVRFDLKGYSEPAVNCASATVGRSNDIKIDESQRVLHSRESGDSKAYYVTLIAGLLAGTCGLVWIIVQVSALPFGLAPAGASSRNPPAAVSLGPGQGSNPPSAQTPDTQRKGDPRQIRDSVVHEFSGDAPAEASQGRNLSSGPTETSQGPNLFSASTAAGRCPSIQCLLGEDSRAAPTHTTLTGATAGERRTPTKHTPTPETRPTTIPGWTLREVTNGTAVLEGPNGIWRATPGQTVPGVGRVDSITRWGNRLIVATSKGLISTP